MMIGTATHGVFYCGLWIASSSHVPSRRYGMHVGHSMGVLVVGSMCVGCCIRLDERVLSRVAGSVVLIVAGRRIRLQVSSRGRTRA